METPHQDWSQRNRDLAGLLARAGLGDRAAFAGLYERSSAHLFAVILRINRDRSHAEDILQEVFVKVWRSAQSFDAAQSQPLTWLTSIARNHAIDSLRRRRVQPRIQPLPAHDGAEPGGDPLEETNPYDNVEDTHPGPLELLNQASQARAISRCMQALNAQQRQCVALAFYSGLTHAEVAEQLREPLGTVKSWVRRGLLALKNCLQRSVPTGTASREA